MKTINEKYIKRKPLLLVFLITVSSLFYYSCDSNSDNDRDIENFNLVTVDVDASEAPNMILQLDTLRISPVIFQSLETDESNLTYEWTVRTDERFINGPIDEEVTTISTERDLEYRVGLTTGSWKFVCRVTDENTGVTSVGYYYIAVQNQFSEGWLILEENNSQGDLSIILPNGSIFREVYTSINPNEPLELPLKQLVVTNFSFGIDEIAILSENSGVQLDYTELLKIYNTESLFWNTPTSFKPEFHTWHGTSNGWIISGGQVHLQVRGGFPGDKKYGDAMAFPNGVGDDYYAAPFVARGSGFYPAAIYDNKGKYFVYLASGLSPLLKKFPPKTDTAAFDMNDVGLEMVYMETANEQSLINAIMKDDSNVFYMLQLRLNASEPAHLYKVMSGATDISNSSVYKSSKTLNRLYYSVDNKIYLYDTPSNLIIGAPFTFPSGETITAMEIDESDPTVIVVATWDGSQGKFYELNIAGTGEISLANTYSGFGKIIDMDYKD